MRNRTYDLRLRLRSMLLYDRSSWSSKACFRMVLE